MLKGLRPSSQKICYLWGVAWGLVGLLITPVSGRPLPTYRKRARLGQQDWIFHLPKTLCHRIHYEDGIGKKSGRAAPASWGTSESEKGLLQNGFMIGNGMALTMSYGVIYKS